MKRAQGKLQELLHLWQARREGRAMPARGDLPVTALRPWLGHLALIDLTGDVPYFRLCGTALHTRFGGEMTGQPLDAIEDFSGRSVLRDIIEKVRESKAPAHATYALPQPGGIITFHEICVPLAHDGEQPDTVLFASYAESRR